MNSISSKTFENQLEVTLINLKNTLSHELKINTDDSIELARKRAQKTINTLLTISDKELLSDITTKLTNKIKERQASDFDISIYNLLKVFYII